MVDPYTNPAEQRNIKADREAADKAQGLLDGRVRLIRRNLHEIGYLTSQFMASLTYASQKSDLVGNPLLGRLLGSLQENTETVRALMDNGHHPIDDPPPPPEKKTPKKKQGEKDQS